MQKEQQSLTIDEAWSLFQWHCKAQRYRPRTIGYYVENLTPPSPRPPAGPPI